MKLNEKDREGAFYSQKEALGRVGENILWNGPFDTTGLPKGPGSSNGKDGIILNNIKPEYNAMPITQKAKPRF